VTTPPPGPDPPRLLDQVRQAIRTRHYSFRTEKAYVGWIRRFIVFNGKQHPAELGAPDVARYLQHLAVRGRVAASTQNQAFSALIFKAAIEALHDVCRQRMGATPSTVAILHTWSQTLVFHPHIHCIVTGGGLSASRDRWISTRPNFLVPVRVLSRVFRGKLLHFLAQDLRPGSSSRRRLLRQALAREWVVYSKPPMAGPEQVLRYLGRYTHRIAIGNERLVELADGQVTFAYRDRRRGNQRRLLTLDAPQFVHRFLLHVLPRRFVRVRHYGLQANGCRTKLLAQARALLRAPIPPRPESTQRIPWKDLYSKITGRDPDLCRACGRGVLRVIGVLAPTLPAPCGRAP